MGLRSWLRNRRRDQGSPASLPPERVPFHVGIIMDGNGRWASRRGLPTLAGHRAGSQALKKAITGAIQLGVRQLTVYSFSTENWSRPEDEVSGLMRLFEEMIESEVPEISEKGIRLVFVGKRDQVSARLAAKMREAEAATAGNERLTLYVAFNYGGRGEIIDAVKAALANGATAEALSEEDVARHLYAADMRDPDLVIRTSGELRLSNFLLWESAYSELYFSDCLWPDFDEAELERAVRDYASRERRFGGRRSAGAA